MDPGQAKRTPFAHQANWQDLDHLLVKLYLHLSGRFLIIQKVLLIVTALSNFKTKGIFIQMNTVPHLKYSLTMACLPLQADQVQCQPKTIEQNYSTSSNHRLGSAGLNALEELLFRCWQ